jgi:hypothetical protein
MFILISITLLVLAAFAMLVLRIWRPDFGYHWLIAAGGAFAAWLMVLFNYTIIPDTLQVLSWGPKTTYPNSIIMNLDQISWPFAVALGTLLLATILSDVVRAYDLTWSNWASSLFVIAIALVGVFSGNLLTFILIWTAFDFIVLVFLLFQLDSERLRRRAVWVFFIHLLGTVCLLIAGVISVSDNNAVLLQQVSPRALIFVVLAAGFRFGALPVDSQMQEDPAGRRSFGTVRSLASMAIVIVLLVRVAAALENVELNGYLRLGLFSLVGLMALLFSLAWLLAKDDLEGRQAWIVGLGMIIVASTLRAESNSSLSWGLAAIFTGGLIYLASIREKFTMWITLVGVLGISALPFTPAWPGLALFSAPFNLSLFLYLFSIIFIIWGFARQAARIIPEPAGLERWIKVIYPIGLLILPLTQFGLGWIYKPALGDVPILGWIIGPLISMLAALGYIWQQRGGAVPQSLARALRTILNLKWLNSILAPIFVQMTRILNFSTSILEGEGGILWVLLSIVLFLAILLISMGS